MSGEQSALVLLYSIIYLLWFIFGHVHHLHVWMNEVHKYSL